MVVRQLKWVEDPQESAKVFSWRWKGWLTGWPHGHIVSRLSSIFRSLFCCHVRTNKSAYLRADTKVTKLDLSPGVHQHIGWLDICRDKLPDRTATQALCNYYLSIPTRRKSTALLTSMKNFQAPQICQAFDHLEMYITISSATYIHILSSRSEAKDWL